VSPRDAGRGLSRLVPNRLPTWVPRSLPRSLPALSGGNRTIAVMALVAVVSLAAGLGLSRLVVSPAQAAADAAPPVAGDITVPVEDRLIANDVTIRGDARYDDPASVRIETGDLDGPAVVTGQVPEVGATLEAATVAFEVAGRPVIVLAGDLPTYRTLRAGVTGPDVAQFKAAMAAIGIDAGDPGTLVYDARAAEGVRALYAKVGYEAPAAGEDATAAVQAARDGVRGAEEGVAAAQRELTTARAGTPRSRIVELDAAVAVARAELDEARACTGGVEAGCSASAVVRAQGTLDTALAQRSEADARPDTGAQQAQVAAAQRALADAKAALGDAQTASTTPLPASEVVFLPSLPRRVDEVSVQRGATVTGAVMSVSGATLEIVATATEADADLLAVGAVGTIEVEGEEVTATVTEIVSGTGGPAEEPAEGEGGAEGGDGGGSEGAGDSGRSTVTMLPGPLTDAQLTALQGSNVRVRIPVSSTDGEVLAVPLAALTAGPGGESRLELATGGGKTELVTVETGLAAGGYVEITGSDRELEAGDLVVVGVRGDAEGDAEGEEADAAEDEDAGA